MFQVVTHSVSWQGTPISSDWSSHRTPETAVKAAAKLMGKLRSDVRVAVRKPDGSDIEVGNGIGTFPFGTKLDRDDIAALVSKLA
jgi:hypothetical protein